MSTYSLIPSCATAAKKTADEPSVVSDGVDDERLGLAFAEDAIRAVTIPIKPLLRDVEIFW